MTKDKRENWNKEMLSLIKKWQKSGISQKEFCIDHDIPLHLFYYWLRKHRQTQSSSGSGFVPVEINPSEDNRKEMEDIQIHYPNGVHLILSDKVSIPMIKALIKAY
jgi:transposase-like protein